MGRKRLRNRITSIIIRVENEVAEFKLNHNEDFEISMDQINHNINLINKKIAKLLKNSRNNCAISHLDQNQYNQENYYLYEQAPYSFKSASNVYSYDMTVNDNSGIQFNQNNNFNSFGIEAGKENIIVEEDLKSEIHEYGDRNSNGSQKEYILSNDANNLINIKLSNSNWRELIDNTQCNFITEEEKYNSSATHEFEDYIAALNNIFMINRKLQ